MTAIVLCASLSVIGFAADADPPSASGKSKPALRALQSAPGELIGITKPNRTANLAALRPSRITRLLVTEGDVVQAGDLLAVLDDGVQRVRAEMATADADSTLDIDLALVKMNQAVTELERLRTLDGRDSASPKELRDVKAAADIARLAYETARFQHRQAVRNAEYERLVLERLHIRAPFAGRITKVFMQLGETVTLVDEVLQVAELHPLEVTVECPLDMVLTVRSAKRVTVRPVDPQWQPQIGEVVVVNPVADPSSQTVELKLTVLNEDASWVSGMKVIVDFSPLMRKADTQSQETSSPDVMNDANGAPRVTTAQSPD